MSTELIVKADEILAKSYVPDRATYFQMKNFTLGKEPTIHGQIWAAVRAIEGKREEIDCLDQSIEDQEDNLALLGIKTKRMEIMGNPDDPLDKEERDLQFRKLERQKLAINRNIEKLKKKIRFIAEELNYYVASYEALIKVVGEARPMDDPEAQRNYWNEKLTEELNLCFLLKRPVNTDLVQTILALDDNMPIKKQMVQILQKVQAQMVEQRERQIAQVEQVKMVEKNG